LREVQDVGMVMANSLDVLVPESHAAYAELHREWPRRLASEVSRLRALRPDLVLSNIPYLPLAAAADAGIPAVALCSLNWAECFRSYCGHLPGANAIYRQIVDAYNQAEVFLNPAPSMPMPGLNNLRAIGPIARRGRRRREELDAGLGGDRRDRLVVVSLGGIFTALPIAAWPMVHGIRYIVTGTDVPRRRDIVAVEATDMPFIDVLFSADALITKPGYGSFTEAACGGVPVLYTRRVDWPEEPDLIAWLHAHGRCRELPRDRLESGLIRDELEALWAEPEGPVVEPTGVNDAVEVLRHHLRPFGA
jgi:hypothetical protein